MMRGLFSFISFISVVFFPWQLTVILALVTAFYEPLMPFAIGIIADTLYYAPHTHTLPLATIFGALLTLGMYLVRSRLSTGIIG